MQFLRMIFLVLLAETVLYLMVFSYLRSLRVEKMEKTYMANHPGTRIDDAKCEEFVRRGMRDYRKTARARLVGLIFVIPNLVILFIIYNINS